jgi:hypothetical protein
MVRVSSRAGTTQVASACPTVVHVLPKRPSYLHFTLVDVIDSLDVR